MVLYFFFPLDNMEQQIVVVLRAARRVDRHTNVPEPAVGGKRGLDLTGGYDTGFIVVQIQDDAPDLRGPLQKGSQRDI